MPSSPITSWQIEGEEVEEVTEFLFLGSKITVDGDCSHDIKRQLLLSRKAMTKLDCVEKQRHYATDKGLCSQGYGLPSCHIRLWQLDRKEGRALENWCFWTVVLEKTPESPLDSKEIRQILYQLSHKGSPRILEWVAYPFSSRSSQPRNGTGVSCIAGRFFTSWATRGAH